MNHALSSAERRRPAAVLWDMDGTIADTESHWIAAAEEIVRAYALEPVRARFDALVGMSMADSAAHLRDMGVDLAISDLIDRHVDLAMRNTVAAGISWRPGAVELLSELRADGIPLALVTMSYRVYADVVIAALPDGIFDAVVAGDEVERGKPFPDAYLLGAELLGVDPRECIAIEDSLVGLAAARAAGIHTVAVPHHVEVPADAADAVWPTLSQYRSSDLRLPLAPGEVG